MFFSVFATAALASSSLVAAAPVHPAPRDRPTGWTKWSLEDYDVYHLRYLALDCQDNHNTTFFEDCCHPMKTYDNLEDRQAYCTPNQTAIASASARIAAQATATITSGAPQSTQTAADEEDDAEEEFCSYESSASSAVAAGETPETTTWTPTSTPASTSTSASASSSSTEEAWSSPSPSPSPEWDVQNKNANPIQESSSTSTSTSAESTSTSTSTTEEATSTTSWEAPKETPSTTSSSEKAEETSDSPAANGDEVDSNWISGGMATFYGQSDGGNSVGACGNEYPDSAMIVAASTKGQYYPNPNAVSPYCGRQVRIKAAGDYAGQGNTVTATIADACPTCENGNSLDLSYAVYDAIGISRDVGTYDIEWELI